MHRPGASAVTAERRWRRSVRRAARSSLPTSVPARTVELPSPLPPASPGNGPTTDRQFPLSPQRNYRFSHEMLRQVAYDTLSRHDRKTRHLAVADHLRTAFAADGEEIVGVIARHYLDALAAVPDDPDADSVRAQAVEALIRAGERAGRTGALSSGGALFAPGGGADRDCRFPRRGACGCATVGARRDDGDERRAVGRDRRLRRPCRQRLLRGRRAPVRRASAGHSDLGHEAVRAVRGGARAAGARSGRPCRRAGCRHGDGNDDAGRDLHVRR